MKSLIIDSFHQTDQQFFKEIEEVIKMRRTIGSTVAMVMMDKYNNLYSINLGDSRIVLGRDGTAIDLSTDHTPSLEEEKNRIISRGGTVGKSIT